MEFAPINLEKRPRFYSAVRRLANDEDYKTLYAEIERVRNELDAANRIVGFENKVSAALMLTKILELGDAAHKATSPAAG